MSKDAVKKTSGIPFVLELELELKTFYLNLALALMLEDTLVGLSVFRGC